MKIDALARTQSVQKNRVRCRKKFLYYFPKGFKDQKYIDWERNYKWEAHLMWEQQLNRKEFEILLSRRKYSEISYRAARIETKTNLLFSFEKMALRDAIKSAAGSKDFAKGLYDYVYGSDTVKLRFDRFTSTLQSLPRRQTRVLTWPLQTVFGFIGNPDRFIFLKPRVTKIAAEKYGYDFNYKSTPNWETYKSYIDFAEQVRRDNADLGPRDNIDLQSFIWVQGSDEYPD
jgi:hypothetical protein